MLDRLEALGEVDAKGSSGWRAARSRCADTRHRAEPARGSAGRAGAVDRLAAVADPHRRRKSVARPVVHDYGNIACRDAVLAYDRQEPATDAGPAPVTRWDSRRPKLHPVTGDGCPTTAQVPAEWRYLNPRQARWPQAEFHPGIRRLLAPADAAGAGRRLHELRRQPMRGAGSADFVMYWWHQAAQQVHTGQGGTLRLYHHQQPAPDFNRRVVEQP